MSGASIRPGALGFLAFLRPYSSPIPLSLGIVIWASVHFALTLI